MISKASNKETRVKPKEELDEVSVLEENWIGSLDLSNMEKKEESTFKKKGKRSRRLSGVAN